MSKVIWVVPIEPVETRYTWDWYSHIPQMIHDAGMTVHNISAVMDPPKAESSDFLNWTATNIYKSRQIEIIARHFEAGDIKDGDTFLICDFWHPGVIQIRYMAVMLGIKVNIVGLAHAGAYDGWDRLAIKSHEMNGTRWALQAEQAFLAAYDTIVFATEFHRDLFEASHGRNRKCVVAGFPMEYVEQNIRNFSQDAAIHQKRNRYRIVFSQRLAPEKQPELFKELEQTMVAKYGDRFEFVNVLEKYKNPSKRDYYTELLMSDLYISFALQETLGITPFEAVMAGCKVLVPDRLSYKEMWLPEFKYADDASMDDIATLTMDLLCDYIEQPVAQQAVKSWKYFTGKELMELLRHG